MIPIPVFIDAALQRGLQHAREGKANTGSVAYEAESVGGRGIRTIARCMKHGI